MYQHYFTVPHTAAQVPELKITGLSLLPREPLSAEEEQSAIQALRYSSELLAAVPNLIIGEPGSKQRCSLALQGWPEVNEELTAALWEALAPLAPRLTSLYLWGALMAPITAVAMDRVLKQEGATTKVFLP